ncbi:hypothetical protein D3C81_1550500 [compost metagenome]
MLLDLLAMGMDYAAVAKATGLSEYVGNCGHARNEVLKWGKYEDVCHLGIIRSEWLNSKS